MVFGGGNSKKGEAMRLDLIIYLLFIHWIADFVFQSDWMAKEKAKHMDALMIHCLVYGLTFSVMTLNPLYGFRLFVVHVFVDFITSRINSHLYQAGKVHWFFVSLGFDQFIHFVTILLLAKGLLI